MTSIFASIRKLVVSLDQEFPYDSSTDTILSVEDNNDGTVTLLFLSCIRKGE